MNFKANRLSRLALVAGLLSFQPLLAGCATNASGSGSESSDIGELRLNLSATSGSGAKYRLRNAVFSISSGGFSVEALDSETDPSAAALTTNLDSGDYSISLENGWYLERETAGAYQSIPAVALSPQLQAFTVVEGGSVSVVYAFKVNGEFVSVGGSLSVSTNILEVACQDDAAEDNDTQATAKPITVGKSYDLAICLGDADYFILPAVFHKTLTIDATFTHADGDLDVFVYSPEGAVVGSSTGIEDNEHLVIPAFPGANAIVAVIGFNGASNSYSLTSSVAFTPAPAGWTCDANYYGQGDGCDCGCSVVDLDCTSSTAACAYDNCSGGQTADPTNNALCH